MFIVLTGSQNKLASGQPICETVNAMRYSCLSDEVEYELLARLGEEMFYRRSKIPLDVLINGGN